ncbi:hypothetical protein INT45_003379 [Circinella minor]|uniref:Uncharacterized protein n=1 Tax=Circinella minor TaxID=1195481 RepID=A0A8H7SBC6_9FUNG|nr:hypothetical protein INT45_003379 [Circinella minor]
MSPITQSTKNTDNITLLLTLEKRQEVREPPLSQQQSGEDQQSLSTVTIAAICVCAVVGIRRKAQAAGFVSFDDTTSQFYNNSNNNKSLTCTSERLPHPETHDLVFNSILEHTPKAPANTLSSPHHHIHQQHQSNTAKDSISNNTTTSSSMDTMMFEDGYEKMPKEDPKILMSLARQRDWTDLYRPSASQLEQQHHNNHHRVSTGSSYHVW